LKSNPRTRHIPVHIISVEQAGIRALEKGAVGFLSKPVCRQDLEAVLAKLSDVYDRPMKDLLVVEDDPHLRGSIIKLIGNGDVACDQAATAAEALQAVQAKRYDCMILDLGLPDMNGLEMLKKMSDCEECVLPPVIVYTGRDLSREEEAELHYYSESIIVKGVRSEERLFDEAAMFLHRMVDKLPAHKRRIITDLYEVDTMFKDKRILVVDDDMRNAFALSGLLEEKGMQVLKAENGLKALTLLEARSDVDLVLMDIMMPVMDGYEAIRQIRSREQWRSLPVIALTAKAMQTDRERCIAAGANDYLVKPLDTGRLFSMLRVWLYR
jgi:CheY-like chemotaxis protein